MNTANEEVKKNLEDENSEQEVAEEQSREEQEDQQEEQLPDIEELAEAIETDDPEELKLQLAEHKQQLLSLEEELQNTRDSLLRKVAELENIKKRNKRDRSQIFETAKINALRDFLPVNDDLRRTLNASEGLEVDDKFLDGVTMVAEKFEEVLKSQGVERIDETHVPFDVDKHDAMMSQKPDDDSIGSDMVLQVLENGYRIGDKTIRHAKVIVSE